MAIGTTIGRSGDSTRFLTSSGVRKVLLSCGILSSLLYALTDLLGGLRYQNYNFSSQAISELMATGAPSERFVDPLFLMYGVLALAFGVGSFSRRGRPQPAAHRWGAADRLRRLGLLGSNLIRNESTRRC